MCEKTVHPKVKTDQQIVTLCTQKLYKLVGDSTNLLHSCFITNVNHIELAQTWVIGKGAVVNQVSNCRYNSTVIKQKREQNLVAERTFDESFF